MKRGVPQFLAPLLAVAVVSFVFVRVKQDDGATFLNAQRQAQGQGLTPSSVAQVVSLAPDPATHARGRSARCLPEGTGELHNPWRCTIRYAAGKRIRYRVLIRADGSFLGVDQRLTDHGRTIASPGHVTGCCIAIP